MAIDISTLSPEDLAAIVLHARAQESAEREARKSAREATKEFVTKFARILAGGAAGPAQTFTSGAVGWSLGGSKIAVPNNPDDPTAGVRLARVSILVRWEDTIPAKDKD